MDRARLEFCARRAQPPHQRRGGSGV